MTWVVCSTVRRLEKYQIIPVTAYHIRMNNTGCTCTCTLTHAQKNSPENPLSTFTCLAINVDRQKTHNIQYVPHITRRFPIKGELQTASTDRSRRNLACRLHIVNDQMCSDKERTFKTQNSKLWVKLTYCVVTWPSRANGSSSTRGVRQVVGRVKCFICRGFLPEHQETKCE